MATHSRILAWKITRMEEPGRQHPMGSQRVRHDSATNTHMPIKGFYTRNAQHYTVGMLEDYSGSGYKITWGQGVGSGETGDKEILWDVYYCSNTGLS